VDTLWTSFDILELTATYLTIRSSYISTLQEE